MEMDIDKSEDELELERLVFGDTEGIKEQLKGKTLTEKAHTDLEHLEDDQVKISLTACIDSSYSSLIQERRRLK